jgi:hypothetical protein
MMRRMAVASAVAVGMVIAGAGAASAADSGNHGAIWDSQHGAQSGAEWGSIVSTWAQTQESPYGVADGVHSAKDQSVPGQNK